MTTMTTIPAMTAQPASRCTLGGLVRLLGKLVNSLVAYRVRRRAVKSLRELDDRALRDIGIDRSQIEAAVRGGTMNSKTGRLR
jgi:uncharacterized protein YjiS (DUF1127 family)